MKNYSFITLEISYIDQYGKVIVSKVRICLLGAGRAGEVHGDVYKWNIPDSEIIAIVDEDRGRLDKLGKKYNIDKENLFTIFDIALSNVSIDGVVITTPTFTHSDYAIKSAKNGINVFCEKPMDVKIEKCKQMIETCKDNKVILQIGFMRRFDEGFIYAKKLIDENEIGRPMIIKTNTRGPGLPGEWAFNKNNSNGMLAEVNSHDFDTVRWLGGSEFKSIYALVNNFKSQEIGEKYTEFYDTATVSGKLQNNTLFLIDGVCPCDYGYDARAEIIGTKGVMFIGKLYNGTSIICTKDKGIVAPQILSWKKRFKEAYIAEDRHFIECILEGKEPIVNGNDGEKVVLAVNKANESISIGKPVEITEN